MTADGKILVGGVCTNVGAARPASAAADDGSLTLVQRRRHVGVVRIARRRSETLIPRSDGKVYLGATCDTGTSSAVNRMCYADIASNGSLLSTYTASVPVAAPPPRWADWYSRPTAP